MEDRLAEMRRVAGSPLEQKGPHDIEMGVVNQQGTLTTDSFREVGELKTLMGTVRQNIKQLEQKYSQSLNAVSTEQSNRINSEIQMIIDSTNASVNEVRTRLKSMEASDTAYAGSQGALAADARIRINLHKSLTQQFLDLVQAYHDAQTNYKTKYKTKMQQQFKIVKPNATQEEIDAAVESGDTSRIFAPQSLDPRLQQQASAASAYIEARHNDIVQLERNIYELHQLFVDMSLLVQHQQELLDRIEDHVGGAIVHTQAANSELKTTHEYQKKSRKKMIIITLILIIVIAAVLAPILATVIPK